ncbi:type III-A CRISPR-associated RAMP protein Csm5 [Acinetobacter modestus]|uniref:type III-A CRISPR-associated RAMP protein Csm5 n=1 Tax=Acinetobacter modestus TaxID=1776740 RepID=UPI00203054F3|nr:type III-A CRISPR-associated RAMP protein Csm5 [Acinetobacter modestus]MCM1960675.1 type III-A CRISPR-associated RAMP protein Csm5 [Acinetobacter modestus]
MSFIESKAVQITTLSPVQLGSGEDFYPTNYVITDEGWLHHFDELALSYALKGNLSKLSNALESQRGDDMILSIQRLIREYSKDLSKLAFYSLPVSQGFLSFYKSRIGQVAQRETGNKRVVNRLQISRTFIHPHKHVPVIPGSALKGAIRTAIVNELAQRELAELKRLASDRQGSKKVQEKVLGYSRVNEDPMKFFKVSDAEYQNSYLPTEIMFSVSRKRKPKANYEPAEGVSTYMEVISPYRFQAFTSDLRFVEAMDHQQNSPIPSSFAEVAKVCNAYYLPKLKLELEQLSQQADYLDSNYVAAINHLIESEWETMLKANKIFVLRLGKFSGAQDKTLDGLKRIKILTPKDQPNEERSETTEVRLAAEIDVKQKHGLLPFGWVLVQQQGVHLPKTAELLDQLAVKRSSNVLLEQALQLKQEKHDAQQKLEGQRAQQVQAEQAKLERQQHEQAEQAALEAKKAQMTEEQKLIFELKLKAEQDKTSKGAGSALYNELRELIIIAQAWSAEDKAALREEAKAIFKQLGVDPKANKPKELLKMVPAL